MKIIIYGLGNRGKEFIQNIIETKEDMELAAVTDSYIDKLNYNFMSDIYCIKPSYIQDYEYDYIVMTPEKYYDEILDKLLAQGITREKIKTLQEFNIDNGKFFCNLCNNKIFMWNYIGKDYDVFKNKHIIGAGRRKGGCPICGSDDRVRFVYYSLKKFTKIFDGAGYDVLHFAPEDKISEKLRQIHGNSYLSADIVPGRADIEADIECLPFPDKKFDYIICNHVMEHVVKEKDAFSELRRCLKKEGILFFSAPICLEEDTYENPAIHTREDRINYFGQEDHVRLYGRDIVKRIGNYGFEVDEICCLKKVSKEEQERLGFIRDDRVFLCKKR